MAATHRRGTRRRVALSGLVLLAVLGGCASRPSGTASTSGAPQARERAGALQARERAGAPQARERAGALALLRTTPGSLRDDALLTRAEHLLVRDCMRARGLTYDVPPAQAPVTDATLTADARPQGEPDGYGLRAEALTLRADLGIGRAEPVGRDVVPRNERHARSLGPRAEQEYRTAWLGGDSRRGSLVLRSGMQVTYTLDGCLATARRELYGSVRDAMRAALVPQDTLAHLQRAMSSDPEYRRALSAWKRCMRERGQRFESPGAALNALQERYDAGVTRTSVTAERRLARLDASCDTHSSLRAVQERTRERVLDEQDREVLQELVDLAAIVERATARARSTIGRG